MGFDPARIRSIIPKQLHYNLNVDRLPSELLQLLTVEMEKVGGLAAGRPGALNKGAGGAGGAVKSGVVLSGTQAQFRALIDGLNSAPGAASALAKDLEEALKSLEMSTPVLKGRGRTWKLGGRTLIMGILNVTPDSFYDGGRHEGKEAAIERALKMSAEGADWIDVGGESTRPGAEPVPVEEELKRVVPVVEVLAEKGLTVSVDTTKAAVARAALEAGAGVVNDVSALSADPRMAEVCAEFDCPVVLMHMRGTPGTMQDDVFYEDLTAEVFDYFLSRLEFAMARGIEPERTVIDPGLGFGKSPEGNLELVRNLAGLKTLGRPVLVGPSRKSFIGRLLGKDPGKEPGKDQGKDPNERLPGTLAVCTAAILGGAEMLRVHDVAEARQAALMAKALTGSASGPEGG
jgi:dihydropteroate synthase